MDSLPNTVNLYEIPPLGLKIKLNDDQYATMYFHEILEKKEIDIPNVDIVEFLLLIQSYCYSIAIHRNFGISYLYNTDLCLRFSEQSYELAVFDILEGDIAIYSKNNISIIEMCRNIGTFLKEITSHIMDNESSNQFLTNPKIEIYLSDISV
jgi:hypothetical protein